MKAKLLPKKKRLVIVNDVRIYLNGIKQIVSTIKMLVFPYQWSRMLTAVTCW